MRILIFSDEYFPTAQACSYRMQVFSDVFLLRGNTVTVITSSANKGERDKNDSCRKEKIIYSPTIRMKRKTTFMRMMNNLSFGITSIFASIMAGKADVVIVTSPPPLVSFSGWMIAKLKRAKLVYDVRDIWPDVALEMGSFEENSFFCRVFRKIASFMYKHSDVITTVSPGKVRKIQNYVKMLKGKKVGCKNVDKVWLVENGFDESILESQFDQEIVDKYGLNDSFSCVYIGNIGLAQGLGVLLDVAAKTKHKDIQFLCFGKGAEKEVLEKKVSEEGITNVKFCGVIDHSKVFSILSRAKLSFIPLKNSNMTDSVPTKVYESLGIGCPVFLVAEGDSTKILDKVKLGKYISPDETENMVHVFDEMVDQYEMYLDQKEEARRVMKNDYSRQKIASVFEKELKQLCQEQDAE